MPINQEMKEFVIRFLRDHLSSFHHYHNYEHTLYVLDKAMEIGKQEQCTEEELELLAIAALWHDTGYSLTYRGHEEESCNLTRHYLPGFGITAVRIETICGMIMATKLPQTPRTKLEEILADADLEYLGTHNYEIQAEKLFREMQAVNPELTEDKWKHIQINFLQQHHFFTAYCKEKLSAGKQEQLNRLLGETL